MRQFSGYVQDELLERIKNHPLRGNRTQQEFYEYIFEKFLHLPESRLAMLEQDLRSLRLQVDFLKERVEHTESLDKVVQNLDSQMQQFASSDAEVSEESHDAATTASPPPTTNCSEELVGDFPVVLEKGDAFETDSKSFVDLMLHVTAGMEAGQSFVDRVMDFLWAPTADFCKRAFGLQAGDSLVRSLPKVLGRKVLVRRTKRRRPDGSPRMMTYYHPLPSGLAR